MNNQEYTELFNKSIDLYNNSLYLDAKNNCEILIKVNNQQPDVFNLLSIIEDKMGNTELAIENSNKAINLNPNNHLYYTNLGEFYKKINLLDKAIENLKKSIEINNKFHGSKYNLANIYKQIGKFEEAEKLFLESINLNPYDYQSFNNLGLLYSELLKYELSVKCYKRALIINPSDLDIKINLISVFIFIKDYSSAEFHYKEILSDYPNNKNVLKDLSIILENDGRIEEGLEFYKKYIEASLTDSDELNISKKMHLEFTIPSFDLSDFEIYFNKEKMIKSIDSYISSPFKDIDIKFDFVLEDLQIRSQNIYHGIDNKLFKSKYAYLFKECFNNLNSNNTFNIGKIRIGFLVTRFNENIFIRFMINIINNLPNEKFDIVIVCNDKNWESKIKSKVNTYIKGVFLCNNILDSSKIILNEKLDILYHWEVGTDSQNYFIPFFRLAPIQCTSIGWPETTGIDTIDYFISSNLIETENAQDNYTEKLVKFNKLPFDIDNPRVISENDIKPIEYFNIGKEKNIYLCCQNSRKIHPDFDTLISGILNNDKNGIVVFIKHKDKNISDLLKMRIKVKYPEIYAKVIFLNFLNNQEYLSLLTHAKVILDTVYFGGANTSYEAFAMNAPVVTYPWTHERGRYTLGCYKQMGIDGLVANNFEEYIDLAFKTANDKEFRDKVVKDISENNHKLFNDKEVIQEYIDFFQSVARNV